MAKQKKEPEKKSKPSKSNELTIKVLGIMETLRNNGIVETNSTTLRDKVGTKTRGDIRRIMKFLAKDGKVVIGEKEVGKRKQYVYRLAG